ncbi:MAG: CsoS2 family carboxysome shell protein [Gammaproteobacteria bacterium]|nr:CsoS2 family carboxysome shell protein [Gammaproteobacteria bacterium]
MPEQTGNSAARGRAAALQRRRAQAQAGAARGAASRPASSAPAPATSNNASLAGLSGRELARARRAMLAQGGKNAVPGAAQAASAPAGRQRPNGSAPRPAPAPQAAPAPVEQPVVEEEVSSAADVDEGSLDTLCEIVERDPGSLGGDANRVRQLCRDRRRALSNRGKAAMPPKPGQTTRAARNGNKGASAINGRDAARQRREAMARNGRGNAPAARPTGRMRPNAGEAPPKVEVGTTLSGRQVTGTMVERAGRVTGNEPGGCRTITGTEYVGSEQYASFCDASPAPGAGKVGVSATSRGQQVSGNEIGRSPRVTGDEAGTCKPVTGTEYLGSETIQAFCGTKGLTQRPEKVPVGATERKGMVVTGTDEARTVRVSGSEPGAGRPITGSQYADAGAARMTINGAPSKVALTHTVAGRPVSGTEVGRSVKVTGDEAGSCRPVSGTEYLSNEQFESVCHTRPAPTPAKVGVDASRGGMQITGNLVDRTEKVTGNEPGACRKVTGAQYGEGRVCGGGVDKVREMHTLSGRPVTGNMVNHGPKMSGDERGGCLPVTGTEYYGQEQYQAYCEGTPAPRAEKVGVSQTPRGQAVSGVMLGRSERVTGNEPGSAIPVSGTPYAGAEQRGCGCGCNGTKKDGSCMTRKATQNPRYMAPVDEPMPVRATAAAPAVEPGPADFSIVSPAREARSRITGNSCGGTGGRITGPVNLATGLVSGTPEFRYREDAAAAPTPAPASAPAPIAVESRVTGEGNDSGTRITGDDWGRSDRVTGTEGHWAQRRNLTQRGEARGAGASAWANKERERPEVPEANITGSSGNSPKGSLVTYSGGARG